MQSQLDKRHISINRIRLEFKVCSGYFYNVNAHSINRIRLEFKACHVFAQMCRFPVLIESDWNLKSADFLL